MQECKDGTRHEDGTGGTHKPSQERHLAGNEFDGGDFTCEPFRAIDFRNLEDALPVVLTMLVMPLTFSITNGIGAGFVSYVLIKLASGKARDVHPALYVVAFLFLIYFLRWALFDARF